MTRTREENAADLARETEQLKRRQAIERQIIKRVIADALADQEIELSLEDVPQTRDADALYAEIIDCDKSRLYFHRKGSCAYAHGWVFFVLGNDGWDVIADYTTNLEAVLAGANALGEELETRFG